MCKVKAYEVDEQKCNTVPINLKVFTIYKHICAISLVRCILYVLVLGYIEHSYSLI